MQETADNKLAFINSVLLSQMFETADNKLAFINSVLLSQMFESIFIFLSVNGCRETVTAACSFDAEQQNLQRTE